MAGESLEDLIPPGYRKYEQSITVAAVNYRASWGNKEANLDKMTKYVNRAAAAKANLIVFPELALTGYEVEPEKKMHKTQAEPVPGPATNYLEDLAKKHKTYIVWGMPELDRVTSQYFNTAVIAGPQGLIGRYRKVHPWIPEKLWCQKGSEYPIFDTAFGPVAIGICFDTYWFPEVARIYALKGARLYLNPTAVPVEESWDCYGFMVQQMKARATENIMYVVGADLVGKELTVQFAGSSLITGPKYPTVSHVYAGPASRTDEEMLVATLDFKGIHATRRNIPVFEERQMETYGLIASKTAIPGM